jgi:hypothetical protein
VTPHEVSGAHDSLEVLLDWLVPGPEGQDEVPVVRLGRGSVRTFVDHEIAPMSFHRFFESFDRFLNSNQIVGTLGSSQRDAQRAKPGGDLFRRSF